MNPKSLFTTAMVECRKCGHKGPVVWNDGDAKYEGFHVADDGRILCDRCKEPWVIEDQPFSKGQYAPQFFPLSTRPHFRECYECKYVHCPVS
jgi:hypothetical protein